MIDAAPDTDLAVAVARSVHQLAVVDADLITLAVSRRGQRLRHDFSPDHGVADVRSLAKVVTVLTLGAAVAQSAPLLGPHPVDLDLPIGPLLRSVAGRPPVRCRAGWDRVRPRHLLANTTGHDEGFLFRTDAADLIARRPDDLLEYVTERELTHEPGAHFAYSNAGWFLLSALISDLGGRSLADWAGDLLLGPLGVPDGAWFWRDYGRHTAAATGLRIGTEHLLTLGELVLDGGQHDGRRLVDADWITAMTTPQVVPPEPPTERSDPLPRRAYGLGLWLSQPAGRCFGVGADGKYLVIDPPSDTVVALTASRADPAVHGALQVALAPLLPAAAN